MKIRAVLTVLLCNVIALLILGIAGFFIVRFAPWGHWAVDSSKASPAQLASKYGDPVALLQRGVFYHTWILGPCISLLVGGFAALMFRRSDWRISTLSVASMVAVLATPTSINRILAGCLYIAASWLAMRLATSFFGPPGPHAAPRP
jgi:hypothetical protein